MPDAPGAMAVDARGDALAGGWLETVPAIAIGAAFVVAALAAYWLPGSPRCYDHFVWQAMAFLQGRSAFPWPIPGPFCTPGVNEWMQDVYPVRGPGGSLTGFALLPFPPLPAVALVPFVAIWGLETDIRAVSVIFGAIGVGLAWWALGRLPVSRRIRAATTAFFAFGTVFWYAAQLGTTWFFAHVIAVDCLLLAIGVALGGDPAADDDVDDLGPGSLARSAIDALRRPVQLLDSRQLAAGFLFGLACTARLSVVFGAPFLLFVGSGGSWLRRGLSAGLGAALPIAGLLAYNVATTGQLIHPGYDYQYHLEAIGYPGLHYNPAWSLEDVRYVTQNLRIMFLNLPVLFPDHVPSAVSVGRDLCTDPGAVRGLFDPSCPIALPDDVGTSILLSSPGYLLAIPALLGGRSRLVAGAFLAVLAIAIFNLMHFSQGWVQFGYRFSNDFAPFAILLVAIGLARRGRVGLLGAGLIGLSIAANLWGVIWGNVLGW